MRLSGQLQAERKFMEHAFGDSVICKRCEVTLETFADACTADLSEACQGFLAIEQAKKEFREGK